MPKKSILTLLLTALALTASAATATNTNFVVSVNYLNSKLAGIYTNVVNAKYYGAKGNAVSTEDDWFVLQQCIESNKFKQIFLPRGTYYISRPLVLYDRQSLIGEVPLCYPESTNKYESGLWASNFWPTTICPMSSFPAVITGADLGRTNYADGMKSALVMTVGCFEEDNDNRNMWWHYASIENLALDCRTQNINGLWVDSPGEQSLIKRVTAINGNTGLLITRAPIPARVEQFRAEYMMEGAIRIAGHDNGAAGFVDAYGHVGLYDCSADFIDTAPIIVEGGVVVLVDRFKYEYGWTNKATPLCLIRGNWSDESMCERCSIDWRGSTALSYGPGYVPIGDSMFLITTNGGTQSGIWPARARIFCSSSAGYCFTNIIKDEPLNYTLPWNPSDRVSQGGGLLVYQPYDYITVVSPDFKVITTNYTSRFFAKNVDFSIPGNNYEARMPAYVLVTNAWGGTHAALGFDNGWRNNGTNDEPWAGIYMGCSLYDPFYLNVDYGTNAAGTNWPIANQKIFQLTRDNIMRFWANTGNYPTNEAAVAVEHFHYGNSNITFNVPLTLSGVSISAWSNITGSALSGSGSAITDIPNNTYNVKRFGAVGDGVTDDTLTLRAAFDAVYTNGGGTVYLPRGTYLFCFNATNATGAWDIDYPGQVSSFDGYLALRGTNIIVSGDGQDVTILKRADFDTNSVLAFKFVTWGKNITFRDLTFDGNSGRQSFTNAPGYPVTPPDEDIITVPCYSTNLSTIVWERVTFRNAGNEALDLDYYPGGVMTNLTELQYRISDCYFSNTLGSAIEQPGWSIVERSVFDFCGWAEATASAIQGSPAGMTIQDCTFRNCTNQVWSYVGGSALAGLTNFPPFLFQRNSCVGPSSLKAYAAYDMPINNVIVQNVFKEFNIIQLGKDFNTFSDNVLLNTGTRRTYLYSFGPFVVERNTMTNVTIQSAVGMTLRDNLIDAGWTNIVAATVNAYPTLVENNRLFNVKQLGLYGGQLVTLRNNIIWSDDLDADVICYGNALQVSGNWLTNANLVLGDATAPASGAIISGNKVYSRSNANLISLNTLSSAIVEGNRLYHVGETVSSSSGISDNGGGRATNVTVIGNYLSGNAKMGRGIKTHRGWTVLNNVITNFQYYSLTVDQPYCLVQNNWLGGTVSYTDDNARTNCIMIGNFGSGATEGLLVDRAYINWGYITNLVSTWTWWVGPTNSISLDNKYYYFRATTNTAAASSSIPICITNLTLTSGGTWAVLTVINTNGASVALCQTVGATLGIMSPLSYVANTNNLLIAATKVGTARFEGLSAVTTNWSNAVNQ